MAFIGCVILTVLFTFGKCWDTHYLEPWKVSGRHPDHGDVTAKATVPGGIYTDLMNAGVIGDIFAGYGDTDYRWVGDVNWTYSSTFELNTFLDDHEHVNLVLEGVDTFTTISINGIEVGSTENMFRRYKFDVKELLKPGENHITVVMYSTVEVAAALAKEQRKDYVVPPECGPNVYHGVCHVNQIRKMQASYAWDWGPAFPSVGFWKDVYLEGFNGPAILEDYIASAVVRDDETWEVEVKAFLGGVAATDHLSGTLNATLTTRYGNIYASNVVDVSRDDYGELVAAIVLTVPMSKVERWWPNGYGEQNVYELTIVFSTDSETTVRTFGFGFRTVELVQDDIETGGATFYFKINGVPVFAKGANEIPLNVLPEKGRDYYTIKDRLSSVKDAQMNMLRVWGGGVYEDEVFYVYTDYFGIMIWQDFMFACALYPTRPDYLENVRQEVRHQVKRLASHPSVILFAGNNENEAALRQNWYGSRNNFELYKSDYIKLYVDTIMEEVQRLAPHTVFITSSPTNGKDSANEGYVAKNPQSNSWGDVHYYNYEKDSLDSQIYPIPRFASEYGYQSMPDVHAWLTTTSNLTDLDPNGPFVAHRQHHPGGLEKISLLISYQLDLPDPSSDKYAETYIFYSQVVQALSIKVETEHYRSFTARLDDQGRGYTMGALYWQLNDVWVAPTWAGIDFTGKWKLLHYFAKNFFSPNLVIAKLIGDELSIYAVSDKPRDSPLNATINLEIFRYNLFEPLSTHVFPNQIIEHNKAEVVTVLDASKVLSEVTCTAADCFFHFTLTDSSDQLLSTNYLFPEKLKNSNMPQANVKVTEVVGDLTDDDGLSRNFHITIITDTNAFFVWLDSHDVRGNFSENGFLQLIPTKTVRFDSSKPILPDTLQSALTITHLTDPNYER